MANYTLRDVIEQIQTVISGISGIREAPIDPPEQPQVFPFSVCMPYNGEWTAQGGPWKTGLQTVTVDIHVGRADLPRAVKTLTGTYADTVPNELWNNLTLNGRVDTIVAPIRWEFRSYDWGGGLFTLCFRFFVQIKMQNEIT